MVYKEFEELCAKFGDMSPHKRIEIVCGMLRLCLAPELRFIGSVVEDLAKKDFHFLREHEIKANRQSDLLKYYSVDERTLRNAMAFNLALLHSWNTTCANIIFDILESNMKRAFQVSLSIENEEINIILLVLTMAMNHPAFTFHQRNKIVDYYRRVEEQLQNLLSNSKSADVENVVTIPDDSFIQVSPNVPHEEVVMASSPLQAHEHYVQMEEQKEHICNIELIKVEKSPRRNDKKHHDYRLLVTWQNDEKTEVTKSEKDFKEFQKEFVRLFPKDGDYSKNDRAPLIFGNPSAGQRDREDAHGEVITNYIKQILTFPKPILDSDHVIKFFKGDKSVKSQPPTSLNPATSIKSHKKPLTSPPIKPASKQSEVSDPVSVIQSTPTMSLTVHNSNLQDQPKGNLLSTISPRLNQSSPSHSPLVNHVIQMDSHLSPEQEICQIFNKLSLKRPLCLQKMTKEELSVMDIPDLVKSGLAESEALRLYQELQELVREKPIGLPNGITEPCVMLNNATPAGTPQMFHAVPPYILQHSSQPQPFYNYLYPIQNATRLVSTRDSSPTGSEYSSPSQSPQLHKRVLNKTSDSSSDENDKGMPRSPLIDSNRRPLQHSLDDRHVTDAVETHRGILHIGCGYQSDPSPSGPSIYHAQPFNMQGACKAQPAHTNLNIPPKNMISMPPDSAGILFSKRGPPIIPVCLAPPRPRSEASVVATTVMTTTIACGTPTLDNSKRRYHTMNGGHRSVVCSVTNSTSVTMASQTSISNVLHAHVLAPTVNKAHPIAASSEPTLSIQQQQQTVPHPYLQAPMQQDSNIKSIPSHNPSPIPGSQNTGSIQSQHQTGTHTSCTSCGCPGHNHMTSYPYLQHPMTGHLMPSPLWHVPMTPTSNGIIPTPHLFPPGFAYHIPNPPKGINPEMFLSHNPNFIHSGAIPTAYSHLAGGSVMNPPGGGHPMLQRSNSIQECKEKPRHTTCHNCGSGEHVASECTDNSMESISGHFHLSYEPKPTGNTD